MNPRSFLRPTTMALLLQLPLPAQDADLLETAAAAGSFTTLLAAIDAAGLAEALRGEGPFTVLAPTDDAFAALPAGTVETLQREENRDRLARILQFHVIPGRLTAARALEAGPIRTLAGESLQVNIAEGRLRVGLASVVDNDLPARNGILHGIDRVLTPPEVPATDPEAAVAEAIPGRATPAGAVFRLAIARGVPLFNLGRADACAAVYEVAIRAVLALDEGLPKPVRVSLEGGLRNAAAAEDPVGRAWQLRHGIDGALRELRRSSGADSGASASRDGLTARARPRQPIARRSVFEFDGTDRARWSILNDDVMGGISTARVSLSEQGTLMFQGRLSLENNGGFASTRSEDTDLGLGDVRAFVLRVRGDGRTYRFGVRTDSSWNAGSWRADFTTADGEWTEIEIPVDALSYSFRGRTLDRGTVDPGRIRGISLLISDKNDRQPFRLEVDWIRAIRSGDTTLAGR